MLRIVKSSCAQDDFLMREISLNLLGISLILIGNDRPYFWGAAAIRWILLFTRSFMHNYEGENPLLARCLLHYANYTVRTWMFVLQIDLQLVYIYI